ncbi:MAG: hypothetical protein RLZZ437_3260 [Pseudomonadota bacterium]|jgi:hypothetical protein
MVNANPRSTHLCTTRNCSLSLAFMQGNLRLTSVNVGIDEMASLVYMLIHDKCRSHD